MVPTTVPLRAPAEGAVAGVTTGGVIGGTLGLLAGVGLLAIPGLGPFVAAGPIVAGLAGIGMGGWVGGFAGALIGVGIPEYEAKQYEGRLQKGGILLSVHCDNTDEIARAMEVLKRTGGEVFPSRANLLWIPKEQIAMWPPKSPAQTTKRTTVGRLRFPPFLLRESRQKKRPTLVVADILRER